jgi:L-amino acid N-acyltransferase YncA
MIRNVSEQDVLWICDIYNHYIEHTDASFEEECLTVTQMSERIRSVQSSGYCWLVAESEGEVIGYAYSTRWSERSAYRYTVEVSVYLNPTVQAQGWGTKLYEALFKELRKNSFHMVIAGITLPNPASIALHEKFGMKKAAVFDEVGYKFGQWKDVGYWQVQLTDTENDQQSQSPQGDE